MDYLSFRLVALEQGATLASLDPLPWWDGPLSILFGTALLLFAGLFVSSFIGNEIIISGLKRAKKTVEKTEQEIQVELEENETVRREIHEINKRLRRIESVLKK